MGITTTKLIGHDKSCFQKMQNEIQARKEAKKKLKETKEKK